MYYEFVVIHTANFTQHHISQSKTAKIFQGLCSVLDSKANFDQRNRAPSFFLILSPSRIGCPSSHFEGYSVYFYKSMNNSTNHTLHYSPGSEQPRRIYSSPHFFKLAHNMNGVVFGLPFFLDVILRFVCVSLMDCVVRALGGLRDAGSNCICLMDLGDEKG